MYRSKKTITFSIIGLLIFASAAFAGLPWSWDMWSQPSYQPYELPVVFPQNSLSTDGEKVVLGEREEVEKITKSPLPSTKESLSIGKQLYDYNCVVCHGPEGKGDGIIVKKGLGFYPVNLAGPATVARTDGFIYAYIRYGGKVLMPAYSENISSDGAWHVVNYVRKLQGTANANANSTISNTESDNTNVSDTNEENQ